MALVFNDRVKETSTTTGTGTLNLGGAVQDFQTFVAGIGNSNETYYNIVLPQTGEFEVGRGVVTDASPDTLSRLEVFTSSNSGNLVDFSAGTKTVFCTLPANKFVPGKFGGTNFSDSIIVGHTTTGTLSSAERNTGVGFNTLGAVTSGSRNTVIGRRAGALISTGSDNILIGAATGQNISTAEENTVVGTEALTSNSTSGTGNTGFGYHSLKTVTSGDYNIGLGWKSGDAVTEGKGNVIIGSNADVPSATGDRQLVIAGYDGSTTTTWISGDSAGALTFADKVVLAANKTIEFGDSGETISGDGTHLTIAGSDHINVNAQGELTLSSESNEIFFRDGTTLFLKVQRDGDFNVNLRSNNNKKIEFIGEDDGSAIDMLVLDGAEAGKATFNDKVILGANKVIEFGDAGETISGDGTNLTISSSQNLNINTANELKLDSIVGINLLDNGSSYGLLVDASGDFVIKSQQSDKDIIIKGNDGGSTVNALTLDMSNAGSATFNNSVSIGDNLHLGSDSSILLFGAGNDVRLTHVHDVGLLFTNETTSAPRLQFQDAGEYIEGDGTNLTIASSNNTTIDSVGSIFLDADNNGLVDFKDGGTTYLRVSEVGNDAILKSFISDGNFLIKGNDGGVDTTALTFDMSEAGAATFNDKIILGASKPIEFGDAGESISGDGTDLTISTSNDVTIDSARDIILDGDQSIKLRDGGAQYASISNSSGVRFTSQISDNDILFRGNDGGSFITALTLDMSEGGDATFGGKIILPANESLELGDAGETIFGDGSGINILSSGRIDTVSNDTGTQSTLITSAGGLYIDSAETNRIDAGTGITNFYKAGTLGISLNIDGNNDAVLHSRHNDKDIKFDGQDDNSTITALTLDMSEAGAATFNGSVTVGANLDVSSGTIKLDGNYPTGTNNVALGDNALNSLTSGQDNTCIGHDTGTALQDGSDNTFIGESAGAAMTSGNTNTAVGGSALKAAATVANTVAIGQDAGLILTSGDRNTFVGRTAGSTANGGNNNICLGYNAEPSSASINNEITLGDAQIDRFRIPGLQSGASTGDVLTYDGTKIVLSTPSTGVSAGFAVAMAIAL